MEKSHNKFHRFNCVNDYIPKCIPICESKCEPKCIPICEPKCIPICEPKKCEPIVVNCYISGIEPSSGPLTGGNRIILYGTGFTFIKNVHFGDILIGVYSVINDNTLTFIVPVGSGVVNIYVSGITFTSNSVVYKYVGAPVVSGINPNEGPVKGGNVVTISGSNFALVDNVEVGGTVASFQIVNDETLNVVIPSGSVGGVSVVVETAGGSGEIGYTYVGAPII